MTYNLLFVDDDVLIAESLRDILDWGRLSLNAPGIAYSCKQAQEVFSNGRVDILVSDIEMVGGDGFRLLEWVKAYHPETLLSFLTCHARFEFAQRAIKLGVFGYLLKPVCEPDLEDLLRLCVARLDERGDKAAAEGAAGQCPEAVAMAVAYIGENLGSDLSREGIAQKLFISESSLSRLFNKAMGLSLSEYITERRVERAKQMLARGNAPITEICAEIGYSYPAYFTKIFREKTSMTPLRYRQMLRGG
jgi:YesN/AraC family two-component response regulator